MLSFAELQRLLNFRSEAAPVASLYLELDGDRQYLKQCRALLGGNPQRERAATREDLERIEACVTELAPEGRRGLAVFSSREAGLWQAIPLPDPAPNLLKLDAAPCLWPLLSTLDQYRRFGVALVDPRRARFFEVYLGEVEELKASGLAASSRIADAAQRRLKAVADELGGLARRRAFDLVILGAPPEMEPLLINHLHTSLQDTLIVDGQLEVGMAPREVLAKVMLGEKQSRIVRESVLVHRLFDAVKTGRMGVVSLPATLQALNEGRARMLLVREGLAKMGKSCRRCGALGLSGKRCAYCGGDTDSVVNVVSEAVRSALEQNCQVFHVLHDRRLDSVGGIGAELGFSGEVPARLSAV
jgi:hypothetical protein